MQPRRNWFRFAALVLGLLTVLATGAAADTLPYRTYTIGADFTEADSPAAYVPYKTLRSGELNLPGSASLCDVEATDDAVYLLDKGANRIYILNSAYELTGSIDGFDNNGKRDGFNAPEGLTVAPDGTLYVADTENGRIVRLTPEGELVRIYGKPVIDVLGEYTYKPLKVGVDRAGRIYVVARSINRGLVQLDSNGEFYSFTGAPRVSYDWFTVLWKTFLPDSASQYLTQFVPTEFSNLKIDDSGFIYTTIKANDYTDVYNAIRSGNSSSVKAVMCINSAGDDVLRRYGDTPILGDVNWNLQEEDSQVVKPDDNPSSFEDIALDDAGCYYTLDSRRGRIFAYDSDGNLLYAFGAIGSQDGNNQTPVAIAWTNDDLLVVDAGTNKLTVYAPTEYGLAIKSAALDYAAGHYEEALEGWREVNKYNGNLSLAYIGMGKSCYRLGQYEQAIEYLTLADEKTYCSMAYAELRSEKIADWFGLIFAIAAVVLLAVVYLLLRNKKEKPRPAWVRRLLGNRVIGGLTYALHVVVHPFDGFWDLKHEKRGNAASATILLALATLSACVYSRYGGYFISNYDPKTFNVLSVAFLLLGPFLLFVVVNWCLTTLLDGSGSMKDIYIAGCYSLAPMVLLLIPTTIISRFISLDETAYVTFFLVLTAVWTAGLLIIGTMTTHEYSVGKTVLTVALILLGMLIAVFLLLMFYDLMQNLIGFIVNSFNELSFRAR